MQQLGVEGGSAGRKAGVSNKVDSQGAQKGERFGRAPRLRVGRAGTRAPGVDRSRLGSKGTRGASPPPGDPSPSSPPRPSLGTFVVLIDAQGNGDVLEGLLVEGADALGLAARHRLRGRGRGGRRRGPGAPLGGHEGAGEALAEPHEEEPQVEGDQAQQREADEERIGEIVEVPLMRRLGRSGRPGGGGRGGGQAGGRRPGRRRAAGAAGAFLLPSSTRRIHSRLPLPPPPPPP